MPRPRLFRKVEFEPRVTYFKPAGIRLAELDESILTVDEFEAVRLKDLEGLEQEDAARKMKISQPTFHRLLLSARKKIADALANGKAIRIEGGPYMVVGKMKRMMGRGAGPGGECECPKCGAHVAHERGVPCYSLKCPKCGAAMARMKII
ncbi:MAG: DUF134 domain-containing protein [Candidatus Aenigmatarchaeota archaeon]